MSVVRVAFLWHMHQPSYRDPIDGTFVMPWVRLHAVKDYLGMVELLERTPSVHATFNLVPSLLDQVEAYARGAADEPVLRLCEKPAAALDDDDKLHALRWLFMAHPQNLIGRFPRFAELLERRGPKNDEASLRAALPRFASRDFLDLQVLARLAWLDLSWQARDQTLRALVEKGRSFDEEDKQRLAERERALLLAIVPAYRRAAQSGRIELSTTPYYHPILPLLCDTDAHHEAHPGAALPRRYRHPEDAADQIRRAIERHTSLFGAPPRGMWPSEGSVSDEAVQQMAKAGIAWTASDEGVLEKSVKRPIHRDSRGTAYPLDVLYRPWRRRTPAGDVAMVFRDRALSDLIGFSYSGMDPEHAARDMLERLRRIGERWRDTHLPGEPLVSVILDGENAWEHFREGGRVFLGQLYQGIEADPMLQGVTIGEGIAAHGPPLELPRVFAGSWIHASFSVWIGHADDRRAWDLLAQARDALVEAQQRGLAADALARAWEIFRAACGSDWCWWYGEEHSTENDVEFDRLFRRHLIAIYRTLGRTPPEALGDTLITTRRVAEARQSRPSGRLHPLIDGLLTTPDEWVAAGVYRAPTGSSMHRALPSTKAIRFGSGDESLHLLFEATGPIGELLGSAAISFNFPGPMALRYRVQASGGSVGVSRAEQTAMGWVERPTRARAAAAQVLETSIPLAELWPAGGAVAFRVLVMQGDVELERHPDTGPIELNLEEVTRG